MEKKGTETEPLPSKRASRQGISISTSNNDKSTVLELKTTFGDMIQYTALASNDSEHKETKILSQTQLQDRECRS